MILVCVCLCVCVFIKLHITAQSGPVLYLLYATVWNPPRGLLFVDIFLATNTRAYSHNSSRLCVCVCVCSSHLTNQASAIRVGSQYAEYRKQ